MALKEIFAEFGLKLPDLGGLEKMNALSEVAVGGLRALGERLEGFASTHGVLDFAERFSADARTVASAAEGLGVSTQQVQALGFAAQNAGVQGEQLNAALGAFLQKANAAKAGGGEAAAAFAAVHARVTDAHGQLKPTLELFQEVAAGLGEIDNPTRRAGLAMQLFGEQGRRLLPIMKEGAGGVTDLMEQFEALGGGISRDGIAAAQRYQAAMLRWQAVSDGLRSQLATALLPILEGVALWAGRLGSRWAELTRGTRAAQVALGALAVAGAAVAAPMIAAALPALALGAALGLAALASEDLVGWLEGKDSLLGRILDKYGGLGTSKRVLGEVRDAWQAITTAIGGVSGAIDKVIRFFTWLEQHDVVLRTISQFLEPGSRSDSSLRRGVHAQRTYVDEFAASGGRGAASLLPVGAPATTLQASASGRTVVNLDFSGMTLQQVHDAAAFRRQVGPMIDEHLREHLAAQADAEHPLPPRS